MRKKVLIISVSAGSGHVRAAEALDKTAKQFFSDFLDVTHIDMMDYVALPIKAVIRSYDILVKQIPQFWGFLYKKSDDPKTMRHFRQLTKHINRANAVRLFEYVTAHNPDIILCTHFLPAQMILEASKRHAYFGPIAVVLTDYDKHNYMIREGVSQYFVATEKMKWKLLKEGVGTKSVTVSGIPVDPIFYNSFKASSLRSTHHLSMNETVILVLSGGYGLAHTDEIIPALFALEKPTTIIAIAGHNRQLEESIRSLHTPPHIHLDVIGWTDRIHEYMAMANVIITKPGGLTTTECIALGKPIIVTQPIPGQEEQNAEFILEHGYGVIAHNHSDLLYYLNRGFRSSKKQRPPMAAKIILEKILKI